MAHSFGDNPSEIHGRAIFGISQGTNVTGKRVRDCDNRLGTLTGNANCSYGASVKWDDGMTYYTDSACLWWAEPHDNCTPNCHTEHHDDPCPDCRDVHRVTVWIPGRVMAGCVWIEGQTIIRCRKCEKNLVFVEKK